MNWTIFALCLAVYYFIGFLRFLGLTGLGMRDMDDARAFGHAVLWPAFMVRWVTQALLHAIRDLWNGN